jgi:kumamolisin
LKIHSYLKHRARSLHAYVKHADSVLAPWRIADLCAAYQWPAAAVGGGTIAIVELDGGWAAEDMTRFFQQNNLPAPSIKDVSVDGTTNSGTHPRKDADGEVALDLELAGASYALATGHPADIRVYWANGDDPNAITAAITMAAADGCDVFSCSWGADEADYGRDAALALEAAAAAATASGMVIFAASGDNDSSDGGPTPANVDCPASAPHVIGCGGTTKPKTGYEVVWNDSPGQTNGDGTGGGYSTIFPEPGWQDVPTMAPVGRMVPDVAGDADPQTGYEIVLYGKSQVFGGTSAVAPLYAGLFAAFGKKLGFVTPKLWANPTAFTLITLGNNGMYDAGFAPSPCTGLGVPIGTKLAALFETVA